MPTSIDQIKKLRQLTNISVQECKKALEESGGDFEKAQKLLKERGAEMMEKKKERETKEGLIGMYLHQNQKVGAMVKVFCESDFVARNKIFQDLFIIDASSTDPKDIDELLEQVILKILRRK